MTIPSPGEVAMTRRIISTDDEALSAAASYLRTDTPSDTVNAALREIATRLRRREAWAWLATRGTAGPLGAIGPDEPQ